MVVVVVEWFVEFVYYLVYFFVVVVDYDVVWVLVVGDGGVFFEEFWVGDDFEF